MSVDFNKSKFSTTYSYSSPRKIIRTLSDSFSRQHCEAQAEVVKYAAAATKGRCLYCGSKMYVEANGIPTFSNTIHYDHIYPASNFGLFEVGNVAIACESCNLAKSDRLPMDYYDMRVAEKASLMIHERDKFEELLEEITLPYKNKWPEHYKASITEMDNDEFKIKLTEILYNNVDISPETTRYSPESSVNWETWKKVVSRAYDTYAALTAKDVEGRIGFTNERFELTFGSDKLMSDITLTELKEFINDLMQIKYDVGQNEIQKYRMLVRMLIEVLNEEIMEGQLNDLYSQVPTFSKIKSS